MVQPAPDLGQHPSQHENQNLAFDDTFTVKHTVQNRPFHRRGVAKIRIEHPVLKSMSHWDICFSSTSSFSFWIEFPLSICFFFMPTSFSRPVVYDNVDQYMQALRDSKAARGPWTLTEWTKRILMPTISNTRPLHDRDRAVLVLIAFDLVHPFPGHCPRCLHPRKIHATSLPYPLGILFRCSTACDASNCAILRDTSFANQPLHQFLLWCFLHVMGYPDSILELELEIGKASMRK